MRKINFEENGRRRIGGLNIKTGEVITSDGNTRDISTCKDAKYFETYSNGKKTKSILTLRFKRK